MEKAQQPVRGLFVVRIRARLRFPETRARPSQPTTFTFTQPPFMIFHISTFFIMMSYDLITHFLHRTTGWPANPPWTHGTAQSLIVRFGCSLRASGLDGGAASTPDFGGAMMRLSRVWSWSFDDLTSWHGMASRSRGCAALQISKPSSR